MRYARHAIRALAVTTTLACAWWSAPAAACGPPPTLREIARGTEQILLLHAVERRQLPPTDCSCSCFSQDHVTFEVLEAWKGSAPRTVEMDVPTPSGSEAGPLVMVAGMYVDEEDGSVTPFPIRILERLDDPGLPALRASVARAVALAQQGDSPDPALLRAHIVESLRHPSTRGDGVLETYALGDWRDLDGLHLSDDEARDLAGVVEKEQAAGEGLAAIAPLLTGHLTTGLRDQVLRRLDEAFASDEAVAWVEPLLRLLGWHGADRCAADEAESGGNGTTDVKATGALADEDAAAADEAAPLAELVPSTPEEERRFQEEIDRYEAEERARWKGLRDGWPALRSALVR